MYEDGRPSRVPSEALRSVECRPLPGVRLGLEGGERGRCPERLGGCGPGETTVPTCCGAPVGGDLNERRRAHLPRRGSHGTSAPWEAGGGWTHLRA